MRLRNCIKIAFAYEKNKHFVRFVQHEGKSIKRKQKGGKFTGVKLNGNMDTMMNGLIR